MIPEKVTRISAEAFKDCADVTSITIPEGVESIGSRAFENCSSLEELIIPKSVETIGKTRTFAECSNLKKLTILNRETKFEALQGSNELRELYYGSENFILYAPVDCVLKTMYLSSERYRPISNDPSQLEFDIENGELLAYTGNGGEVIIPNGVTKIGVGAFSYYPDSEVKITSIKIPDTITSIGSRAFENCSSLEELIIPQSVETIGKTRTFAECSNLKKLTILNRETKFEALQGSNELRELYDGSEKFILYAPVGCALKTMYLSSDRYRPINNYNDFEIENGVLKGYTGTDENIVIPDGVTKIAERALGWKTAIKSIKIPDTVVTIENSAFYGCTNVTSIEIPEGVESIGKEAFRACSSLEELTIPKSVRVISSTSTFADCSSLKKLIILNRDTGIFGSEEELLTDTYDNCSPDFKLYAPIGCKLVPTLSDGFLREKYKPISADPEQPDFDIRNYDDIDMSQLLVYTGNGGDISIPKRVTHIGPRAFFYYTDEQITSIKISDTVTAIERAAFEGCKDLKEIVIPDSVQSIADNAFINCGTNFVIFCGSDSYAKEYAKKYGYKYRTGEIEIIPPNEVKLQNNILTYGDPLSNLKFDDSANKFILKSDDIEQEIEGTLKFKDPELILENTGEAIVTWIFTPKDITYPAIEGTVPIIVNRKQISINDSKYPYKTARFFYTEKAIEEPLENQFEVDGILDRDFDKYEPKFTFSWYKGENRLSSAPVDVGDYILKVEVAESKNYTLASKEIPIQIEYHAFDDVTLSSTH